MIAFVPHLRFLQDRLDSRIVAGTFSGRWRSKLPSRAGEANRTRQLKPTSKPKICMCKSKHARSRIGFQSSSLRLVNCSEALIYIFFQIKADWDVSPPTTYGLSRKYGPVVNVTSNHSGLQTYSILCLDSISACISLELEAVLWTYYTAWLLLGLRNFV